MSHRIDYVEFDGKRQPVITTNDEVLLTEQGYQWLINPEPLPLPTGERQVILGYYIKESIITRHDCIDLAQVSRHLHAADTQRTKIIYEHGA